MEQRPVLSWLFYCTLLILGLFFAVQGIAPFLTSLSQRHRSPRPAVLEALNAAPLPSPQGLRHHLNACRYRYEFHGRIYFGQRFSLFDSQRYSRELPHLIRKISDTPLAYVDPARPMDAVLLLDPPLSSLSSLAVGLLFFHCGAYFCLLWLFRKQETRRKAVEWKQKGRLSPDGHSLLTPGLLLPGAGTLLFLPFSFSAVPRLLSSPNAALLLLGLYLLTLLSSAVGFFFRLRGISRYPLTHLSWSPRNGLKFCIESQDPATQARLRVSRLVERRFSWVYRETGQAEFERDEDFFTLAPYSFKASSGWHRPLGFLFTAMDRERKQTLAESEALCQILAGQSSSHKSRSPLMGLMRKRPDHRLEIRLRIKGPTLGYSLPVSFWTSEISR